MKTAKAQSSTTATTHLQTKKQAQPFFQKSGGDSVLTNEQTQAPFFSAKPTIQTKLTIGQPGDKYEQEADHVADTVVQKLSEPNKPAIQKKQSTVTTTPVIQQLPSEENTSEQELEADNDELLQKKPIFESAGESGDEPDVQRMCSSCAEEEGVLQAKSETTTDSSQGIESRLTSTKGGGSPLPEDTRSGMEQAFGADFSGVRVHTGSDAVQMNNDLRAQAFTHGSDIYFNLGKYETSSQLGKHLLAHELTHTVQQGSSSPISNGAFQATKLKESGSVGVCIQREINPAIYSTCLTPDSVRGMSNVDIMDSIDALKDELGNPRYSIPDEEAYKENFLVLVNGARSRNLETSLLVDNIFLSINSEDQIASASDVTMLQTQIDVISTIVARKFPNESPLIAAYVEDYRASMRFLLAAAVEHEQQYLSQAIKDLEILQNLLKFIPSEMSESTLSNVIEKLNVSIAWAVQSLLTHDQMLAMVLVEQATMDYLNVFTRVFLEAFEHARQQIETMNSEFSEAERLEWANNGYAQSGQIVFPWVRDEIARVKFAGEGLLSSMDAIGETISVTIADDLMKRLALIEASGDQISHLMQKARAINAAYVGLQIYDVLVSQTASADTIVWTDVTLGEDIRIGVIQASLNMLQEGEIDDSSMASIESLLTSSSGSVQQRVQKIEEFRRKMDWFVTIVSTLAGMRAFTAVSGFMATGLQTMRVGAIARGSLSFVASSLAFTGASSGTRAVLTWQTPSLEELGEQALMDAATLGVLKGATLLAGLRYGGYAGIKAGVRTGAREGTWAGMNRAAQGLARGVRLTPHAISHGVVFTTLWTWSNARTLMAQEGGITMASLGETVMGNGVRTAIDLAVLSFLNRALSAPTVSAPPSADAELAPTIESEWNGHVAEYRRIGEQLRRLMEPSERNVAEVEQTLEQARISLTRMRLMLPRFFNAKMLNEVETQEIDGNLALEARSCINIRDALRLGIESVGETGFSYLGGVENVMQYLARLKSDGVFTSVQEGIRPGLIEVMTADGQFMVFFPRGGGVGAYEPIDILLESLQRAAPDIPASQTNMAAERLRLLPAAETRQLTVLFEQGRAESIIRWVARTDSETAFQAENNLHWPSLLRSMIEDPQLSQLLLRQRASSVQAWYESGFERIESDGQKTPVSFTRFLLKMETYNGTLDVIDAVQARGIVDGYLRTSEINEFNPVDIVNNRGPSISNPDRVHGPYFDTSDYLVRNNITEGEFISATLDNQTWIVRFLEGQPRTAYRFPNSEYPPDLTVDLARSLADLTSLVSVAEDAIDPAVRASTMLTAQPLMDRLSFLGRLRGGENLNDVRSLLQRANAMHAGNGPLLLPSGHTPTLTGSLTPLQQRGQALYERQQEIRRRAERLDMLQDPDVSLALSRRPTRTSIDATMDETQEFIEAAESVLHRLSAQAIRSRFGGTHGQALRNAVMKGKGLSEMSETEIGDALHLMRGRHVGEVEIRSLLQAQQAGASIRGIINSASSAAEREVGLRLFSQLYEANVPGAEHLIRDLGVSKTSWRGSMWLLRYIERNIGMNNLSSIARIELTERGEMIDARTGDTRGIERRTDIVMKDGRHIELKSWSHWFGESLAWQFSKDLSLRTQNFKNPNGIFQLQYAFEGEPYIPDLGPVINNRAATEQYIRNYLRETLEHRMDVEGVDSLTRAFVLEVFDHHRYIVTIL